MESAKTIKTWEPRGRKFEFGAKGLMYLHFFIWQIIGIIFACYVCTAIKNRSWKHNIEDQSYIV